MSTTPASACAIVSSIRANLVVAGSAALMMAGTFAGSLFGFVFWLMAARSLPPDVVGGAAGTFSALNVLAMAAECGVGTLLLEGILRAPDRAGSVRAALSVTIIAAAILAAMTIAAAGLGASGLSPIAPRQPAALLFAAGVVLLSVSSVADQACYGLLRAGVPLERNLVFSLVRLATLPAAVLVLRSSGTGALYVSLTLGASVGLMWVGWRTGCSPSRMLPLDPMPLVPVARRLLGHHALNLTTIVPNVAMPFVASAVLGASTAAPFYVAWLLANFTFLVGASLTNAVLATEGREPASRVARLRFSLVASILCGVISAIALIELSQPVLSIFGPRYASAAGGLKLLGLAAVPCAIRFHFIAVRRFAGSMAGAAGWFFLAGAAEITLAITGGLDAGLPGLCLGWTLAVTLQGLAMIPAIAPALLHRTRAARDIPLPSLG